MWFSQMSPYKSAMFTTRTYTRLQSKLSSEHWLSSCSLVRDKEGSLLVAIIGGYNSSVLEAWNPKDGTVRTLAQLPSNTKKLISSQLIAINNNEELLLYGGYSKNDTKYLDDIWHYTFANNTWIKVSTMSGPKSDVVVLPVEHIKIKCDWF
jgi:hypothetical protein